MDLSRSRRFLHFINNYEGPRKKKKNSKLICLVFGYNLYIQRVKLLLNIGAH